MAASALIVGAGDLARGTAILARAFGWRSRRWPAALASPRVRHVFDRVLPVAALHERLAEADAVVVTVPHTPETETMIDAAAFAAMKPGAPSSTSPAARSSTRRR